MSRTESQPEPQPLEVSPRLSLWDTISLIVGIVVGVSIFKVPSLVFGNVAGPVEGLAVWVLGGVLTLIGTMCYAELATTYPRLGGDYVYLSRAYGAWVGFLFAWIHLVVVLTSSIASMAFVFADYAMALTGLNQQAVIPLAAGAVVVLTVLNILGAKLSTTAQNVLTIIKSVGLLVILVGGFAWGQASAITESVPDSGRSLGDALSQLGTAMIFVLYAYGGWNDAVFVAAEMRDVRRNLPRALILSIAAITLIYVLINAAYLMALGFEGVRGSDTPAADVLEVTLGHRGSQFMSLLVMASALGAINAMIFTGSRVFASMGRDHVLFSKLGKWNPERQSPVWSLAAQCGVILLLMLAVGTAGGRNMIDAGLVQMRLSAIPWDNYGGGFDTLVAATAPIFWSFFLLTTLALFVLRRRDVSIERPFPVPLYPVLPIVFSLVCAYMLYASVTYAKGLVLLGVVPLLLGIPLYFWTSRMASRAASGPRE